MQSTRALSFVDIIVSQEVKRVSTNSFIVLGSNSSEWEVTPMSNAAYMARSRCDTSVKNCIDVVRLVNACQSFSFCPLIRSCAVVC